MAKTTISKKQLILSIIFNGGNTLIFFFVLKTIYSQLGILKYLTYLSYIANSIFLLFCLLCDIFIYLSQDNNSDEINNDYALIESEEKEKNNLWYDKLNDWNRNKYCLVCNPFSFFVTFSFWILYFLGKTYIKVSSGFIPMTRTYYFHLIITLIILLDIFISKRKKVENSSKYTNITLNLFLIYAIFICIMKYYYNIMPYAFLNSSFLFLVCYMIFSFVLLYLCSYLNIWLVNYVNKNEI